MTAKEFRRAALLSGYGCEDTTDCYIRQASKAEFTADDFVELYRCHERYMMALMDQGTRHMYQGARSTKHFDDVD